MSPFALDLSEHARIRIKERRISRSQIRTCIAKERSVGSQPGGRQLKRIKFGKRALEVIYLSKQDGVVVITAYWRNVWP